LDQQNPNFGGVHSSNDSHHPGKVSVEFVLLSPQFFICVNSGLRTRGRIETDGTSSVDDILDQNLDEMSLGLSRLKNLVSKFIVPIVTNYY